MGWKQLTFVLIPHSQEHVKQFRVHRAVIYGLISFLIVAIGIMIFYILGFKSKDYLRSKTVELHEKNNILEKQVSRFDSSLTILNTRIAELESTNATIIRESGISEMDLQQFGGLESMLRSGEGVMITERVLAVISRMDRESEAFEHNYSTLFDSCLENDTFMKGVPSIRPAEGTITKEFGRSSARAPGSSIQSHSGIDITWDEGTPVLATADGTIEESRFNKELGQYVVIDHQNGYKTRYAHLQTPAQMKEKITLKRGQAIKRGEIIGSIGRTGINIDTTPSHIMYSVFHHGIPVNPVDYFFAYDFRETASADIF